MANSVQVLSMYMKKNKHKYETAVDGLEALETYKNASPPFKTVFMGKYLFRPRNLLYIIYMCVSLVWTPWLTGCIQDISMPVMDGLASTRNIRAFELENNIPPCTIVVLTGLGSASMQQDAYSSGANLVLIKPVKLKELGVILDAIQANKDRQNRER